MIKQVEYRCPKCGGQVGYFTGLSNYYEVFVEGSRPKYSTSAGCQQCGFRTKTYDCDTHEDDVLKELVPVYVDTGKPLTFWQKLIRRIKGE